MIDILRREAQLHLGGGRIVSPQVRSTLAKVTLCQTAPLGGRYYTCDACEQGCVIYNSCGDRHCPQCRGARRNAWAESTQSLLLEGMHYYQVVFTIPQQLSALALGNRRVVYGLLFRAAWRALRQTIQSEHGIAPAALMVLHTWNQRLEHHPHIHAVVPGAGPSLDGSRWVTCRRDDRVERGAGNYLVDADRLRANWREAFLHGLEELHQQGKLSLGGCLADLQDPGNWQTLLDQLRNMTWVSFIQPPPTESTQPQEVVRYLSRYLTGGPISDRRIIAADARAVTFWAREGTTPGGDRKQVSVTVSAAEFLRRWCLHVLPKDFTKVRRFGGWANRECSQYQERCAIMMETAGPPLSLSARDFDPAKIEDQQPPETEPIEFLDSSADCPTCPHCGRPMQRVEITQRPNWKDLFDSDLRLIWYPPDNRCHAYQSPLEGDVCNAPTKNWHHQEALDRIRKGILRPASGPLSKPPPLQTQPFGDQVQRTIYPCC